MVSIRVHHDLPTINTGHRVLRLAQKKTDWQKLLEWPDISWFYLLIAAAGLVVMIWIILRLIARVQEDVDPAEADHEMLSSITELRREGDLTEDEFRSIKGLLMGRLGASMQAGRGSGRTAKTASPRAAGAALKVPREQGNHDNAEAEVQPLQPEESIQSEFFVRSTNVINPSQNTDHQSEGLTPSETENSLGITQQGSADIKGQ